MKKVNLSLIYIIGWIDVIKSKVLSVLSYINSFVIGFIQSYFSVNSHLLFKFSLNLGIAK